ncbi:MAG: hypothetical protein NTV07_03755 [Candidatus Omnitrophica bacterium]|nr:hypothetical protein [Candidatus Omnitrophota bacterium]
MIKTVYIILWVLFLSAIVSAAGNDFTADIVSTSPAGTFTGKIFSTKDKTRMEMPQAITITRLDKKITWMLMPAQKMYMEVPIQPEAVVAGSEKMPGEIERKLLVTETLGGRTTDKYRIRYVNEGVTYSVISWIDKSSDMPLKTAAEDNSWSFEYRNIDLSKQPDSLFEIPADYQKMVMPNMQAMTNMADMGGEE